MAKEQLFEKHLEAIVLRKDHVPISIQYTIDVLEMMKEDLRMGFPFVHQRRISLWLNNQIEEQKNLLKK